jgi:hypothetical protein
MVAFMIVQPFPESRRTNSRRRGADYVLAAVSTGTAVGSSGRAVSQSQPSRMQARTAPLLYRFSTINGAAHFGQGSAIGWWGVVKSHSGYLLQP